VAVCCGLHARTKLKKRDAAAALLKPRRIHEQVSVKGKSPACEAGAKKAVRGGE
jgi:hypothetical protein